MVNIRSIHTITANVASIGTGLFGVIRLKIIQIEKCVTYCNKKISKINHKNQYPHQKIFINATALIIRKNKLKISNHCFLGNKFWLRKKKQYSQHHTEIKSATKTNISSNDITFKKI